ncbi:MAG: response regulator [Acidobacteriota bacterium]|nr:response regulator [Acidobacteriota bacterium]
MSRKRILYIEDDDGLARLFRRGLQRQGYVVEHAPDGGKGLAMIQENEYDLIAIDQHLPVYDGLDVIEKVIGGKDVPPIIMVTGTGDEKTAVRALKLGAQDYIVKDVEGGYLELLPSVIEQVFTKRKLEQDKLEAETRLVSSEARYRNLVELSPDGIIVVQDSTVVFANASAGQLLGRGDVDELTGLPVTRLFKPEEWEGTMGAVCDEPGEEGGTGVKLETTLIRKDGSLIDVEVMGARINYQGQMASQLVLRDISARKAAELEIHQRNEELEQIVQDKTAQLEEANQEMGYNRDSDSNQKATDVLHNVKNVLTSLIVSTKMMEKIIDSSRVGKVDQVADLMKENRENLGEFITRDDKGKLIPEFLSSLATVLNKEQKMILDELYSLTQNLEHVNVSIQLQQSSAKVHQSLEELNVEMVFEEAVRVNQVSIRRHGITLERRFEQLPKIPAFHHMVLQILVNLISNAAEAMTRVDPERRVMILTACKTETDAILQVTDHGVGIAPETMGRIFGYGFTTRKSGHGFGLHSCRQLAEQMQGSLEVASEGIDKGATFTLMLPLEVEED